MDELTSRSPGHRTRSPRWSGWLTAALTSLLLVGQAAVPSAALVPAGGGTDDQSAAVATTSTASTLPDPAILAAKLRKVSTKGIGKVGLLVTTTDGQVLTERSSARALTPASTMKVLTTMTALDLLGAGRTFSTSVVDGGGGRIVLVGGGDPLLTDKISSSSYRPASLQSLAKATVTALKAAGRTKVALRYDASLFSGPTWSSHWKKKWRGWEAKVAALEINSGTLASGRAASNPARTAADAFAKRLRAAGIRVTSVASARAPAGATRLAAVTSASVGAIIERTLLVSDNVAAETLSRHAAIAAGASPSFAGAAANVKAWLAARGLWTSNLKILDGSGLAPGSRLTPAVLAAAIRLALSDAAFAPVVRGMPVAGESGTLKDRFDDPSEKAGRHVVHAKTGTLSRIAGLAGYLTTAEGSVLVFAELANEATSYYRAYDWLDREAAVMAGCGCR
jgi:D-alanyl-D-alanine carboxypeptidase/D-alanyl-D-alanine-endopeptidase (penicillin-binding protein 4)